MGKLSGKVALVTGGGRGIGKVIAGRLAADGALVAVHSAAGEQEAQRAVADIVAAGGRAFGAGPEFGQAGAAGQIFGGLRAELVKHTGEGRVDIVVSAAGLLAAPFSGEITPGRLAMTASASAQLSVVREALPMMADGGRIINISAGLGRPANPHEAACALSQVALEMASLHFARQLGARGITVNTVALGVPGEGGPAKPEGPLQGVLAGLPVFGRAGEAADVAGVVAFIASDDARWVTGAWIDVTDGALRGGALKIAGHYSGG